MWCVYNHLGFFFVTYNNLIYKQQMYCRLLANRGWKQPRNCNQQANKFSRPFGRWFITVTSAMRDRICCFLLRFFQAAFISLVLIQLLRRLQERKNTKARKLKANFTPHKNKLMLQTSFGASLKNKQTNKKPKLAPVREQITLNQKGDNFTRKDGWI